MVVGDSRTGLSKELGNNTEWSKSCFSYYSREESEGLVTPLVLRKLYLGGAGLSVRAAKTSSMEPWYSVLESEKISIMLLSGGSSSSDESLSYCSI